MQDAVDASRVGHELTLRRLLGLAARRLCSTSLVFCGDEASSDIVRILEELGEDTSSVVHVLLASLRAIRKCQYLGCASTAYLGLRFAVEAIQMTREGYTMADCQSTLQQVVQICSQIADSLLLDRENLIPDAFSLSGNDELGEGEDLLLVSQISFPMLPNDASKIKIRRLLGAGRDRSSVFAGILLPIPRQVVRKVRDWKSQCLAVGDGSNTTMLCASVESIPEDLTILLLWVTKMQIRVLFTKSSVLPHVHQLLLEESTCLVISSLIAEEFVAVSRACCSIPVGSLDDYEHDFSGRVESIHIFEEGWAPLDDVETFELPQDRSTWFGKEHQSFLQLTAIPRNVHSPVAEDAYVTVLLCDKIRCRFPVLEHQFWKQFYIRKSRFPALGGGTWEKYCMVALGSSQFSSVVHRFSACFEDFLVHCLHNKLGLSLEDALREIRSSPSPLGTDMLEFANRRVIVEQAKLIAFRLLMLSAPNATSVSSSLGVAQRSVSAMHQKLDPFSRLPIVDYWK
eukprot:ANDGO_03189.mRNA.1 hypothetical protein